MPTRRTSVVIAIGFAVVLAAAGYWFGAVTLLTDGSDRATVTITDGDGETLATVDAAVADTPQERYTGLSDHDSLGGDEGMLFVFQGEDERSFVMRDMAFPIDIIFVGSDGAVTSVHEAPVEGDGSESTTYRGRAQWVLEVRHGYADENDVSEGDEVHIDRD